jgi:hypothetical protein
VNKKTATFQIKVLEPAQVTDRDMTEQVPAPAANTSIEYTPSSEGQYDGSIKWETSNNNADWYPFSGETFTFPGQGSLGSSQDIKAKFGISATGTTGVTDTFNALHTLISNGTIATKVRYRAIVTLKAANGWTFAGLETNSFTREVAVNVTTTISDYEATTTITFGENTFGLAFSSVIKLGDYIDLPSLTIDGTAIDDTEISMGSADAKGHLLRLLVVGRNSFKPGGSYPGVSNAPEHLVFQFQNLPVTHNMEATATNDSGYAGSAMKAYLNSKFLPGLRDAGVPDSVLWAPTRKVANAGSKKTGPDDITDKLWLPTVWEMTGGTQGLSSATFETAANQARLEYYTPTTPTRQIKYIRNNAAGEYWLASPSAQNGDMFCYITSYGGSAEGNAYDINGVAPAFCVK